MVITYQGQNRNPSKYSPHMLLNTSTWESFNLHLVDSVLEHQASSVKLLRVVLLDASLLLLLLTQRLLLLALGFPILDLHSFGTQTLQ